MRSLVSSVNNAGLLVRHVVSEVIKMLPIKKH